MEDRPVFCRHSGDLEACSESLIDAWREGSIGTHCIMEGLKANWHECRQILLKGLYDRSKPRTSRSNKAPDIGGATNDLKPACKQVVLEGYPLEIKAVHETFLEAYYELMRFLIYKCGYKDDSVSSADDVFQEAYKRLHEHLLKNKQIERSLAGYIARVTINTCINPGFGSKKSKSVVGGYVKEERSHSAALVPQDVVEHWEDLDHQLLNSDQGNLISRTILAQQCVEACSTGDRPSAKDLKSAWQILSRLSKKDMVSLHDKTVLQMKDSSAVSVTHVAAELINAGTVEPHQVAIIFAAGTGMDLERTCGLINQLCNLSDTAIFARISRIYRALRPLRRRKKNENECSDLVTNHGSI